VEVVRLQFFDMAGVLNATRLARYAPRRGCVLVSGRLVRGGGPGPGLISQWGGGRQRSSALVLIVIAKTLLVCRVEHVCWRRQFVSANACRDAWHWGEAFSSPYRIFGANTVSLVLLA